MTTVTTKHLMIERSCYTCKMPFLVPEWLEKQCFEENRTIWCPACRSGTVYRESEVDRLKRELGRRVEYWQGMYDREAERHAHTEARRRSVAGHLTRAKKRSAAGVCPCCKRHFSALERHMKSKHPEFVEATKTEVEVP